jgi:O-antigen ligase/polysaccharide polymerase Wzy-like membrane protein
VTDAAVTPPQASIPPAQHGGLRSRQRTTLINLLVSGIVAASAVLPLLAGRAHLGQLLFPWLALVGSFILFRSDPEFHVSYLWYLWFVTPLVRRLIDYQSGWNEQSPVLLTPLLATGVCLLTLLRHLPKLARGSLVPFAMTLVALPIPLLIGMLTVGPAASVYSALTWLVPLALGYHFAVQPERYPGFARATQSAFAWGALGMGIYGILQFVHPMPWDQFWMLNSGMGSIGQPIAYQVRVFSTLNSPLPFAVTMLAALLILLTRRPLVHWVVGAPAYVSFLLSLARTAWLAWVIGVLTYAAYLSGRARMRVLSLAGAFVVVLVLLLALGTVVEPIKARFQSLGELQEDVSYNERATLYVDYARNIIAAPLGQGLGYTGGATRLASQEGARDLDSGIIDIFVSLGWVGALLVGFGMVTMVLRLLRRREAPDDHFAAAARGIVLGLLGAILSLNTLAGLAGAVFWGALGLALAAQTQHAGRNAPIQVR